MFLNFQPVLSAKSHTEFIKSLERYVGFFFSNLECFGTGQWRGQEYPIKYLDLEPVKDKYYFVLSCRMIFGK